MPTFFGCENIAKRLDYVMVPSVGIKLCSVYCERLPRLRGASTTHDYPYIPVLECSSVRVNNAMISSHT